MITETPMYKTNGKIFEDQEKAKNYELDLIREQIDKMAINILNTNNGAGLKRHHITDIVLTICPDYEETRKLIIRLNKIIN